mgnify:FL=1
MLDSIEWVKLRCFEYELQELEIKNIEPIVREYLQKEINRLKEKEKNGS